MNKNKTTIICLLLFIILFSFSVNAAPFEIPNFNLEIGGSEEADDLVLGLQILVMLTILTLAPAILVMMTSFTRIVIVLGLIRNALAVRKMPPNQVIIGLALFLTFFIMGPIFQEINQDAIQPYMADEISQEEALDQTLEPLRTFMFKQTREKDLALFVEVSNSPRPGNYEDIKTTVLIPAFVLSEIKKAFEIGFIIYIPFLIIDMFVASTLMSLGMMMLPPVMISLPFKLLLFILVDGWYLVIKSLITTFN